MNGRCEEMECGKTAKHRYNGMELCDYHYSFYINNLEKIYMECYE